LNSASSSFITMSILLPPIPVEITDNIVSEGKALWDNPGQFLMTRILGKD